MTIKSELHVFMFKMTLAGNNITIQIILQLGLPLRYFFGASKLCFFKTVFRLDSRLYFCDSELVHSHMGVFFCEGFCPRFAVYKFV